MVSFSSSLHVDPQAGVAAFASSNISYGRNYRPRDVSLYACQLLRAMREGGDTPDPAPTRTRVQNPELFAGVYTAASGERFAVRKSGADQVAMHRNGVETRLQNLGGPMFVSADPRFETTGLLFEIENERVARAWADEVEFLRDGASGYQPPAPAALQQLAGVYDSDDRWARPIWVIARSGGLYFNNYEPMTLLDDGAWRVGSDEWSPERARFETFIDGRPQHLIASGAPFVRRFS
jgi:hypothetical protein